MHLYLFPRSGVTLHPSQVTLKCISGFSFFTIFGAALKRISSDDCDLYNSGLLILSINELDCSITNFVKLFISFTASLVIF